MPARTQSKIRRDINRLAETIERHGANYPALLAVKTPVASAAELVNRTWKSFQEASVTADKERNERDTAISQVRGWIQRWRPVVLLTVPGTATNLRNLPPTGATADDVLRVADDLVTLVKQNPGATSFKSAALQDLGDKIPAARKETDEATAARPAEQGARDAYTEATLTANAVLVRGTEIVRAIFGPTSAEYKQFIGRGTPAEEEEENKESATGESRA